MQLAIYSLKTILFQGEAASVTCKTTSGEITILDHHRPLISELAAGVITITDNAKKEHYIPVASGFLEVEENNRARCIVEEGGGDSRDGNLAP